MLEQVQIIKENDQAKFAVIPYEEYVQIRELLQSEEKLTDYLDYLHMQTVKREDPTRLSLDEVKRALSLD